MKKIPLGFLILFSFLVKAQDDLLSFLEVDTDPMYISSTFKGEKVVNGQSVEMLSKGVLQFQIQHRFGTLNSGFYNLYGLDNSQIRLGFDYGIKDWMSVGIGRSSVLKTIDASAKLKLKRQNCLDNWRIQRNRKKHCGIILQYGDSCGWDKPKYHTYK